MPDPIDDTPERVLADFVEILRRAVQVYRSLDFDNRMLWSPAQKQVAAFAEQFTVHVMAYRDQQVAAGVCPLCDAPLGTCEHPT